MYFPVSEENKPKPASVLVQNMNLFYFFKGIKGLGQSCSSHIIVNRQPVITYLLSLAPSKLQLYPLRSVFPPPSKKKKSGMYRNYIFHILKSMKRD